MLSPSIRLSRFTTYLLVSLRVRHRETGVCNSHVEELAKTLDPAPPHSLLPSRGGSHKLSVESPLSKSTSNQKVIFRAIATSHGGYLSTWNVASIREALLAGEMAPQ